MYKRLFSLASTYAAGNVAQQILAVVLIPLYTTYLSAEDYGVLALMTTTITLITRVVLTPVNNAFGRYYYKPEYSEIRAKFLFNLSSFLLVQIIVLAVAYWCCAKPLCALLFDDSKYLIAIKAYSVILFLKPISTFFLHLIRLLEMASFYVIVSLTNLVLSCGIIIYLMIGAKLGILAIVYGHVFGLFVICLMCVPIYLRHCEFRILPSILKGPLKYGYPLVVEGYSNFLIESGDRYVLRLFSSLGTVGFYSFGYRISSLINILFVVPLKHALQPLLLKKEDSPEEQKGFLSSGAKHYYLGALFVALALSLFAKESVMILARKKEFWACWPIIPIISFSYVQHGLGNFLGWGLVMKNKPYLMSRNLLISAATNILLNFALIPYFGVLGAASATGISYLIWNTLKIHGSSKYYSLYFDIKNLVKITIIGCLLYLVSLIVANSSSIMVDVSIKSAILLLYPLMIFCAGILTLQEKQQAKRFLVSLPRHLPFASHRT